MSNQGMCVVVSSESTATVTIEVTPRRVDYPEVADAMYEIRKMIGHDFTTEWLNDLEAKLAHFRALNHAFCLGILSNPIYRSTTPPTGVTQCPTTT